MKQLPWSTALVVCVTVAAMTTLALVDADTSNFMLIVLSLLGGMGAEQLRGLRENTNGARSELLAELAETRKVLAALVAREQTPPGALKPPK